jgi:hypothetical protein
MVQLDISEKECRDAIYRVSTRVLGNAYLISGDVYWRSLQILLVLSNTLDPGHC